MPTFCTGCTLLHRMRRTFLVPFWSVVFFFILPCRLFLTLRWF
ncbi:hypothetical protein EVA_14217 [gut metagenome]|uniref:Uncharacterized protein n=1 Tax=gut metagenome TaxID=749906 RepID=J9G7C9_9ZZZZ